MKLVFSVILLGFLKIAASGQDYYLSFEGTGASNSVDSVKVENLTQGTELIFPGSEQVRLLAPEVTSNPSLINNSEFLVYPNPFSESCKIEFVMNSAGTSCIQLFDMNGKFIERIECNLSGGAHVFQLSGLQHGIYALGLQTPANYHSTRIVSLVDRVSEQHIRYLGENPFQLNSLNLKNGNTDHVLYYTKGDLLKITGTSGNYSTIIMEVPDRSKTITFNLMSCTDADGNNYPVVQIGDQW